MTYKTKKILAIAVGVAVLVVVILAVLAKILITPERIKMALIPRAEAALQRPLEIGDVEISLFSGILVKDVIIREKSGEAVFVAADTVALRYRFWPLFLKRVVVDEVLLEQPRIRIERLADGTFNFSDLLAGPAQDEEQAPSPDETAAGQEGQGGVDLLISTIALRGGEITIIDHQVPTGEPFRYQFQAVNLQIDDLSLEEEFPIRLESRLGEALLALSGRVDPKAKTVQADLSLSGFDVMPFQPYFAKQLPGRLESLLVDLKLNLAGDAQRLASEGRIDLRNIGLQLQALPDAPLQKAEINVEYALKLDQPAATLEISRSRLAFNGIPVTLAGKVTGFPDASALDMTLNLTDLDLRKAMASLPAGIRQSMAGLDPSGGLNLRLHLVGDPGDPKGLLRDGEIRLDEVQANLAGQRSALTGLLTLQGDNLSARGLSLVVGQNRAKIDLQAKNLAGKPIVINTALTSELFNLDSLMQGTGAPVAGKQAPSPSGIPSKKTDQEEIGPLDLPVTLSGTARINQAVYKGLTIEQLRARYRLENNVLLLDELTGNVAGGSFSETARVDLGKKGLQYTSRLTTRGIQANPLVSAFFPKAAGTVFGGLDLQLDLAGKGTRPAALRQALTAQGDILLQDGKLTGAGLVEGLANFLDLGELRELNFQQAKGRFAVNNGRIALDSALKGNKLQMAPKGTVGLDGALDLALGLRLAPQLVEKLGKGGKFTSVLKDEEGWGRIPLNVAGTATKPRFALDTREVRSMVEEKAREKLQKTLQEKLFDKKKSETTDKETTGEAAEEKPKESGEKLLEGVFKGLFGK
jgi:AsmA protein